MNTQFVRCVYCQRIIQVPEHLLRQDSHPLCTPCAELTQTFGHRHSLSMDLFSLEDVNTLTAQLFEVCTPTTCTCMSSHSAFSRADQYEASYWFSCTCESISLDLLKMLASLCVRFTLRDTVTRQEALHFWPCDTAPRGMLMPLLMRDARTTA